VYRGRFDAREHWDPQSRRGVANDSRTFYNGNNQVRVNGAPNNTQGFRIEGMDATNSNNPNITGAPRPTSMPFRKWLSRPATMPRSTDKWAAVCSFHDEIRKQPTPWLGL